MFNTEAYFLVMFLSTIYPKETSAMLEPISSDLDNMRESITSCVLKISKKYFDRSGTISISLINPDSADTDPVVLDGDLLGALFKCSHWTILTKQYSQHHDFFFVIHEADNYIIQVRNSHDVLKTMKFLKLSSWNPHARFVIITATVFDNPVPNVIEITKTLWSFRVINAIVLIPRSSDKSLLDIYTWYPYSSGHCGDGFNNSVVINSCRHGKIKNKSTLFPDKVPLDMKGCPVKVRTVIWPPYVIKPKNLDRTKQNVNFTEGLEIMLMNTLAEAANFTVIYSISTKIQDWGHLFDNGSTTGGMMRALMEETVDIGMAALAATKNRFNYLNPTYAYSVESITWCVPIAELEPHWLGLLKILTIRIWIASIFTFNMIVLVIWRIAIFYPDESTTFKLLGSCYLYLFCTTLGITLKTLPKQPWIRFIYLLWVIYSLHLCVAYQTSLMSKLTQPDYETQITTLEEIFDNDLLFGFLQGTSIYFEDKSDDWKVQKIQRDRDICDDAEKCLSRVARSRDYAVALPRLYLMFVSGRYVDKNHDPLFYWFKDSIISYPIQLYSYKGYPLINRLDDLTVRVKAAGLLQKWLSDAMLKYMARNLEDDDDDNQEDQVLTVLHLEGAFVILIFGQTCAAVLFAVELMYYRIKNRKLKK